MQFLLTVPAAILCVIPIAVSAHHSRAHFSGEFREVEGEIVSRRWGNPHAGIVMRAVNEQGEEEIWRVDLLGTGGLTRDAFATGQRLTVAGPLSSGGVREILATNLLAPDGIEVLPGAVEPYWSANLAPGRVPARVDTLVDGTAENRGLFRVWSPSAEDWERYIGALHGYFFLGELSEAERTHAWSDVKFGAWQAEPYTEAAIAGRADWDPLDNFATRCEPEGMPRIMMNPNPFEFVDQGSEITLRSQLYAVDRTIHLDRTVSPEGASASSLGYSLGHWEGNTLVVETTRVNWPWLDNNGTPQSEAVEFVERFSPGVLESN